MPGPGPGQDGAGKKGATSHWFERMALAIMLEIISLRNGAFHT